MTHRENFTCMYSSSLTIEEMTGPELWVSRLDNWPFPVFDNFAWWTLDCKEADSLGERRGWTSESAIFMLEAAARGIADPELAPNLFMCYKSIALFKKDASFHSFEYSASYNSTKRLSELKIPSVVFVEPKYSSPVKDTRVRYFHGGNYLPPMARAAQSKPSVSQIWMKIHRIREGRTERQEEKDAQNCWTTRTS